ncbi:hypothetical protein BSPWISOXPB_9323 [uncultured Gammaproteobacteria bacterium]|nr:hypothetical protein BSPWISOXPB_9323 [uncultured Gammaproteobacteria bacterium]
MLAVISPSKTQDFNPSDVTTLRKHANETISDTD